jgi:cation diffusion facilitator family transporter
MSRRPHQQAQRAAAISLGATAALVALKFTAYAVTGSLAVLAQALDSVLDIVALGLVYLGIRLAAKPPDDSHHYGHAKAENLAAFSQTILIALVALGVAWEAADRLGGAGPVVQAPWYAIALLAVSVVVDLTRVVYLTRTARSENSEALRAGALNIAGDLGTASVALISLLFVRSGTQGADAVGALLVAIVVLAVAMRLAKRSADVLMDRAPIARLQAIEAAVANAPGVHEARRVRVRGNSDQLFADVTVSTGRTVTLERAHDISESVEDAIQKVVPGTDVVVHVEPETGSSGVVERVQAAASKAAGVHEIHNVLVHAFDDHGERKLHVTLHAKVPLGLSLKDAHDLSDGIEEAIQRELGVEARVDTHIEPLQPATLGHDVTSSRADLVSEVERLATAEADVLDCHEILVTSSEGVISVVAHVHGDADLDLAAMHDAATRIENNLRVAHPDVGPVLIHFEPL